MGELVKLANKVKKSFLLGRKEQRERNDWFLCHLCNSLWVIHEQGVENTFSWKMKESSLDKEEIKIVTKAMKLLKKRGFNFDI